MSNNFNNIAWVYDFLAHLIFGGAIRKAQLQFLDEIQPGDNVLIVGGGTGWLLDQVDALGKERVKVTYIDFSKAMINKSRNRGPFENIQVQFVCGTQNDIPDRIYQVIITHFFLDVFDEKHLPEVMNKLRAYLVKGGLWLFADFKANNLWWQRWLLKSMHWFFRLTANLESKTLTSFHEYFRANNMEEKKKAHFYKGMIESILYEKNSL